MKICEDIIRMCEENFDGSFYLTFAYEGIDNVDLQHITHTYFGDCSSTELTKIIELCDLYFKANPFQSFNVEMTKESFFGKEKEVRVLEATVPSIYSNYWIPKLAKLLYEHNKSSFKDEPYRPHTTTDKPIIISRVDRIAIMSGNSVIREWR